MVYTVRLHDGVHGVKLLPLAYFLKAVAMLADDLFIAVSTAVVSMLTGASRDPKATTRLPVCCVRAGVLTLNSG